MTRDTIAAVAKRAKTDMTSALPIYSNSWELEESGACSQRDTGSMMALALLGTVFLPGTYIAVSEVLCSSRTRGRL
jgi:hypothetical protein